MGVWFMDDEPEKWKDIITASRKTLQHPIICRNYGKLANAIDPVSGPSFKPGTAPNSQQDG
jgi:hypothetical protein